LKDEEEDEPKLPQLIPLIALVPLHVDRNPNAACHTVEPDACNG